MVRGRNNPEIINGREFDEEGFDRTNASTWVEYKVDKKRLIKAYKGKGSFARFNLLVWKLIFYKAWFSATGATLFRPFARNALWQRKGIAGKRGENNDIGLRGYTLLSFPPLLHCYVDIVSPPPPKPAYLRAFRTVLFAFSLPANWNSRSLRFTLRVLLLCPFSLFLSLSTSSFSAILIIIASRPAHPRLFVICLSPCRHSSPFSQLYYIALLFFFTAASTREEGRKIVTLWLNEVRALLKFRSLATEWCIYW